MLINQKKNQRNGYIKRLMGHIFRLPVIYILISQNIIVSFSELDDSTARTNTFYLYYVWEDYALSNLSRYIWVNLILTTSLSSPTFAEDVCHDQSGCAGTDLLFNDHPFSTRNSPTLFQWSVQNHIFEERDLNAPLVTDRPDFTEASSSVGLGVSQIEFGYTFVNTSSAGAETQNHSFGEPLLRHGIYADWLELRIAGTHQELRSTAANAVNRSGLSDLYLGFKIALTPQAGHLPEMAIIPQMNVPTGNAAFTSGNIEPGLNWIYTWEINDFISTAGSTQGNRRIDDTGSSYYEIAQSWTIAYSLTEEFGAYTEWYALIPSGADTALTQHYLNGGFTYLLSDNIQFDIRAGLGLSNASDDYFIGTGFSVRFP